MCSLFIGFTTDAKANFLPTTNNGKKVLKTNKKKIPAMPAKQIKTKDQKRKNKN